MEALSELCNPRITESQEKSLCHHLISCYELKSFYGTGESDFVSFVNRLLNELNTRKQGVYLLKVFLSQGSQQVIGENIASWCQQLIKCASISFPLSFDVLCRLIELSIQFPDCRKHLDQTFISMLLDKILAIPKSEVSPEALTCFETCLHFYGKTCKILAEKLESYLISVIDEEKELINPASRCFARVQALRTPDYWHERHISQIKTLHSRLDALYENVDEIKAAESVLPKAVKLNLPPVPNLDEISLIVRYERLANQFCRLARYLESTLLVGVEISRKIAVEAVLEIVTRALSVTTTTLASRPSAEASALTAQIPFIHRSVLGVLNSLILCGQSNLLPYSSVIAKTIAQVFKITEPKDDVSKPFEFVREKCYVSLKSWLRISGVAVSLMPHMKIFFTAIMTDIKISNVVVSLNISEKKGEKKRKRKKTVPTSCEVVTGRSVSSSSHLCLAALSSLGVLISTSSTILSTSDHRMLQQTVIKLLLDQIRSTKEILNPYSVPECRAELYSSLAMLCLNPHPSFPPPLHFASYIFNKGLNDKSPAVSEQCRRWLLSIDHIIRPSYPSFNFPIEVNGLVQDSESTEALNRKKVSETLSPANIEEVQLEGEQSPTVEEITSHNDDSIKLSISSNPTNLSVNNGNCKGTLNISEVAQDVESPGENVDPSSAASSPNNKDITIVTDDSEEEMTAQIEKSKRSSESQSGNLHPKKRSKKNPAEEVVELSDDEKKSSDCEIIEIPQESEDILTAVSFSGEKVTEELKLSKGRKSPSPELLSDDDVEKMLSSFVDAVPE